jgi:hypothetical protein
MEYKQIAILLMKGGGIMIIAGLYLTWRIHSVERKVWLEEDEEK